MRQHIVEVAQSPGLHALEEDGERTLFTLNVSSLAGAVRLFDATRAIELAAIAESHAIAHYAVFTTQQELTQLVEDRPGDVAAACERANRYSYEEAVAAVFAIVDRLIAEHGESDAHPA